MPPPLPSSLKSRPKGEDSRKAEGEEIGGGERGLEWKDWKLRMLILEI